MRVGAMPKLVEPAGNTPSALDTPVGDELTTVLIRSL